MTGPRKIRKHRAAQRTLLILAMVGLAAGSALAQGVLPRAQPGATAGAADAAYEQSLRAAHAFLNNGEPAKAYALLEPLEFAHAGEERFDYLIGIAALDSGKPDTATFALERVLAVNPGSPAARLEMARAYYQLGDFSRARTEFLIVAQQDIPAAAHATVAKYLDEIEGRESGSRTRVTGYAEGTAGRDSNVNFSTNQTQIVVNAIPVGPITLAPANIETADGYRALAAGAEVRRLLGDNWQLDAGADWRKRIYSAQNPFDTVGLDGRAGASYSANAERFRFGLAGGRNRLGGALSYDTAAINAEWRHAFSPADQANLFIQQVRYRYATVLMQPNDFDQQAAGVGWLHVSADGRATLSGSLYRGREKDVSTQVTLATPNGGRADGPKRFSGFRLGAQAAAGEHAILFLNAGVQFGHYERTNPLFLQLRNDRYSDAVAGATWNFARRWTVRPQLNFSKNSSNIVIYSYVRRDVSLNIRRDFR